jgi:hypothetical protein
MKAIVTVIGKDKVGIIAQVSTVLAENMVNILDISQTILQDYFTMIGYAPPLMWPPQKPGSIWTQSGTWGGSSRRQPC